MFNPRNHVQVWDGLWIADFLLPSNFYYGITSCGAYGGHYCNRALDRRAAAVMGMAARQPTRALQVWAGIDRDVMADAAFVPGVNMIDTWYVSQRIANYQNAPLLGPQLTQMWVR